jgi:ribosomal protein S13
VALPQLTDEQRAAALMKVSALLEALPKVGKVKAQEIMTELEIAPTRRLRGLGDRQRKALLEKFDFS